MQMKVDEIYRAMSLGEYCMISRENMGYDKMEKVGGRRNRSKEKRCTNHEMEGKQEKEKRIGENRR